MASNGKKGSGNAAPTQNEQKKPKEQTAQANEAVQHETCLLYTSPSPRD